MDDARIEVIVDQEMRSLGFYDIKKEQKEAIMAFVSGRDVFVALPTGYGKSVIYGSLPRVFDSFQAVKDPPSIVVVVSPLKALMSDQCRSFTELGMTAACAGDRSIPWDSFLAGKVQIVSISPESLTRGKQWREILKSPTYQEHLVGLIVDEAHLIRNW